MPIKLYPPHSPSTPRSPYWYGIGSYLGVVVHKTTGATRKSVAKGIVRTWERAIERGRFNDKPALTFADATLAYLQGGGDDTYTPQLIAHFGSKAIDEIDQAAVDNAAATLYPTRSNATRNRSVHTPVSAILNHVGKGFKMKRPKGAQGKRLTGWLTKEKAFALFEAALVLDLEFWIYLIVLLYTGCRLSEPLKVKCDDVNLQSAEFFVPDTKNGDPRRVFLPPTAVAALANHPRKIDRAGEPLFKFTKSGGLYGLLELAGKNAGVVFPPRQKFHLFRHSFATWLRREVGADIDTLLATGAWKSPNSVRRYMHVSIEEEAQKAALLPAPKKVG
jgi:integrase